MDISKKSIGQIVADDYRSAGILRSFGLDFCCGGGKTLERACLSKNIAIQEVLNELSALDESGSKDERFNEWSPGFLAEYIEKTHHSYIRKTLPDLNFYAQKVSRVHGKTYPVLNKVKQIVEELSEEISAHLHKEEKLLFPLIKKVGAVQYNSANTKLILSLTEEHDKAGELMKELENLTQGFTPPEWACASFRVLYQNLDGFQKDLHQHVHLENNILFPKFLKQFQSV